MRRALLVLLIGLGAVACGDSDEEPTRHRLDDSLRLNEIQVLGSHNSYHVRPRPELLEALTGFQRELAESLEYDHRPLTEQFDELGVRQIELDVFADPDGGLYAERVVLEVVGDDPTSGVPELDEPGFKVLHVVDVDFESTCFTLVACLEEVRTWSRAHPGHVLIMILIEAKDLPTPDPLDLGFVVPSRIGPAELDALDAEIRSVFGREELLTPDDVRGHFATLEAAVLENGWPTLGASRGQVLFALDNEDRIRDDYRAGHRSLRGRVMFTAAEPGDADAAFVKRNDPSGKGAAAIRALVERGYLVRTRADGDTIEARAGDTTRRDAALASGAQFVSTDYAEADTVFSDYAVAIPRGSPARCNPVNQPEDCAPTDVEDPERLSPD